MYIPVECSIMTLRAMYTQARSLFRGIAYTRGSYEPGEIIKRVLRALEGFLSDIIHTHQSSSAVLLLGL